VNWQTEAISSSTGEGGGSSSRAAHLSHSQTTSLKEKGHRRRKSITLGERSEIIIFREPKKSSNKLPNEHHSNGIIPTLQVEEMSLSSSKIEKSPRATSLLASLHSPRERYNKMLKEPDMKPKDKDKDKDKEKEKEKRKNHDHKKKFETLSLGTHKPSNSKEKKVKYLKKRVKELEHENSVLASKLRDAEETIAVLNKQLSKAQLASTHLRARSVSCTPPVSLGAAIVKTSKKENTSYSSDTTGYSFSRSVISPRRIKDLSEQEIIIKQKERKKRK
jgi:hypothetical protein